MQNLNFNFRGVTQPIKNYEPISLVRASRICLHKIIILQMHTRTISEFLSIAHLRKS